MAQALDHADSIYKNRPRWRRAARVSVSMERLWRSARMGLCGSVGRDARALLAAICIGHHAQALERLQTIVSKEGRGFTAGKEGKEEEGGVAKGKSNGGSTARAHTRLRSSSSASAGHRPATASSSSAPGAPPPPVRGAATVRRRR